MVAKITKVSEAYFDLEVIVKRYPMNLPLCLVRADSRYTVLASKWRKADKCELFNQKIIGSSYPSSNLLPFTTGYMGAIPYDSFGQKDLQSNVSDEKIFRVYESYIFDELTGGVYLATESDIPDHEVETDIENFLINELNKSKPSAENNTGQVKLNPLITDDLYLNHVEQIIADIKSGRFYQLNYLRYFDIDNLSSFVGFRSKFLKSLEPYSLWIRSDDEEIMSFSPERFVRLSPEEKNLVKIIAEPIKGTRGRKENIEDDELEKSSLQKSKKDLAELHMIVDLLRNDLNRVAISQSVKVVESNRLMSFKKVHHLVAKVEAILKDGLTYLELFQNILPAGSITGTPKKEVMEAILSYENRNRNYFMGIGFVLDIHSGNFDSSVLIRTLYRKKTSITYAAGSGLVIKSDPNEELKEIFQKCRVMTDA